MNWKYLTSKHSVSRHIFLQTLLFTFFIIHFSPPIFSQKNQHIYQFEETNDLIAFVKAAATGFHIKGEQAFIEFGTKNSKWLEGGRYLFIYDLEGNCVFHPTQKELVNTNCLYLKDMNGKPLIKIIVDIASNPDKPNGWIHYLWAEQGRIFPG